MKIKIYLKEAVSGYWDGGLKDYFEFENENPIYPKKGIIRWGSWEANYWFEVKEGKTPKLSIKYALQSLRNALRKLEVEKIVTEV